MSYGDFHSMLEGVTARLAESTSFDDEPNRGSFDDDGRDSVDAIVRRNIQEVVEAADQERIRAGDSTFHQAGSTSRQQRTAAPSTSRPQSGRVSGSGAASGGGGGSSALDVPGHAEATLRLHKARIRGLEDELSKLTQALTDRDKQLAEAKKESKVLKLDQASWSKTQKTLEAQVEKHRRGQSDAEAALKAREAALKELGKEGGRVDKERKVGEAEARARDVRLQRALEEVEKYKSMLGEVKAQEREGKDVVRSEYNRVVSENRRLERQRAELVVAFKKQLKLIDVLKRQRLHLEASRALQFTEQEFMQTLEMGNS